MRLLDSYRHERIRLIAPTLLMSEVCNVLAKRHRRGELTASQVKEAHRLFTLNAPIPFPDSDVLDQAVNLAIAHGQTVYDCLYLALALQRGCDLITADRKFHNAMSPAYATVLHL